MFLVIIFSRNIYYEEKCDKKHLVFDKKTFLTENQKKRSFSLKVVLIIHQLLKGDEITGKDETKQIPPPLHLLFLFKYKKEKWFLINKSFCRLCFLSKKKKLIELDTIFISFFLLFWIFLFQLLTSIGIIHTCLDQFERVLTK